MNIDNLTFGELKTIAALFSNSLAGTQSHPLPGGIASPLIGASLIMPA